MFVCNFAKLILINKSYKISKDMKRVINFKVVMMVVLTMLVATSCKKDGDDENGGGGDFIEVNVNGNTIKKDSGLGAGEHQGMGIGYMFKTLIDRETADFDVSVDFLIGRDNYWQDNEGHIHVKIPPDLFGVKYEEEEAKKRFEKMKKQGSLTRKRK